MLKLSKTCLKYRRIVRSMSTLGNKDQMMIWKQRTGLQYRNPVLIIKKRVLHFFQNLVTQQVKLFLRTLVQPNIQWDNCTMIKQVPDDPRNTLVPSLFLPNKSPQSYGPLFSLSGPWNTVYYYFDGSTNDQLPTHDPSGTNSPNQMKNVVNPHGNILIRGLQPRQTVTN